MTTVQTSKHKSDLPLVDDETDLLEASNVDVARGPFAAHVDKSDISVKQVTLCPFPFCLSCYSLVDTVAVYLVTEPVLCHCRLSFRKRIWPVEVLF